jgi:hypothetical protein
MASLGNKGGVFLVRFRYAGKEYKESLKTRSRDDAKAAAAAVGVSNQTLRAWHAKWTPPSPPCGQDATAEELRAENQRLRKELRRAELALKPAYGLSVFVGDLRKNSKTLGVFRRFRSSNNSYSPDAWRVFE